MTGRCFDTIWAYLKRYGDRVSPSFFEDIGVYAGNSFFLKNVRGVVLRKTVAGVGWLRTNDGGLGMSEPRRRAGAKAPIRQESPERAQPSLAGAWGAPPSTSRSASRQGSGRMSGVGMGARPSGVWAPLRSQYCQLRRNLIGGTDLEDGEIEIRIARLWLWPDGIIRAVAKPGASQSVDDAREVVATLEKLNVGGRRPVLADIGRLHYMDSATRRYYSSSDSCLELVSAAAVLVSSPISRVIGSFLVGLNRVKVPIRLFSSEPEALEWLRRYL